MTGLAFHPNRPQKRRLKPSFRRWAPRLGAIRWPICLRSYPEGTRFQRNLKIARWSWIKRISRRGIRMPIHRVLPEHDIPRRRQRGSLRMRKGSSGSVRVFYPEFDREEIIQVLSERLEELGRRLSLVQVVLFGSYAKGNYTVGSDIDLLVVYKGERRDDAFATVKKVLDIPRLEPHLYTEEEYKNMEGTLSRMTKEGVLLMGSESAF